MALRAQRTCTLRCLQPSGVRAASTQTGPQIDTSRPPPFPYGPTTHFRRADSGLFGASTIQFGNKVSEKNEIKSRRVWRPNIHNKRLWSNYLQRFVQVKVQARVLRTIDKLGGLDEYLVGSDSPARVKSLGVAGWSLRWRVMQSSGYRARVQAERRRLGLPEQGWDSVEKQRLREERLQARAAAEAYLDILDSEAEMPADGIEEEVERATGDVVSQLEAEGAEAGSVQGDAQSTPEAMLDMQQQQQQQQQEEEYEIASQIGESIDASEQHRQASEAAYAHLAALTASIKSTPAAYIKQARDVRRLQAQQAELTRERKDQEAEERANVQAEIESALATHHSGDRVPDTVRLYRRYLTAYRREVAQKREREGKKAFSAAQMEMHVQGPPRGIARETWFALAKAAQGWMRVEGVKRQREQQKTKSPQQSQPRVQQQLQQEVGSPGEEASEALGHVGEKPRTKDGMDEREAMEAKRLAGKATWYERFKLMLGRGFVS